MLGDGVTKEGNQQGSAADIPLRHAVGQEFSNRV